MDNPKKTSQPEVAVSYEEPDTSAPARTPGPVVRLETVVGVIPQVTAAPTWIPKLYKDGFAFGNISGTRKLFIFDFTANAWYYVTLTAV